jgi:ferritin-like metal-binding protein YciE
MTTCPHCGHPLSKGELSALRKAERSRGGFAAAQVVDTVERARKGGLARWAKQKEKQ